MLAVLFDRNGEHLLVEEGAADSASSSRLVADYRLDETQQAIERQVQSRAIRKGLSSAQRAFPEG